MQWWCAAQNVAWSWTWRAYPGVWLFVLAIGIVFVALKKRAAAEGMTFGPRRTASFAGGLLLLWIALDWPVGALGAGYLASLHMVQFLILAMIAPPLLLWGLDPRVLITMRVPDRLARILRLAVHPLTAILFFTAVMLATHLPVVTDRLMPTQWGAFLIDFLWILSGCLYWWPILQPVPARAWLSRPVKMAYLFAAMVAMTAPGAMITFSDVPIYATYELAPPIPGVSPLDDQRIAGIGMRFGGSLVIWIAISVLFFRWSRDEEKSLDEERLHLERRAG
jgi:putative membrane protein